METRYVTLAHSRLLMGGIVSLCRTQDWIGLDYQSRLTSKDEQRKGETF